MKNVVIAYLGLDGACAVAMALQQQPEATLLLSSARRIGETLDTLRNVRSVQICGVGVDASQWELVRSAAERLRRQHTEVLWHCGRGYLEESDFLNVGLCNFPDTGSNTAAVAELNGNTPDSWSKSLIKLAKQDPALRKPKSPTLQAELLSWQQLIEAAKAHYLKYQDGEPYLESIRKLARQDFDRGAQGMVDAFQHTGWHNVHHSHSPVMRRIKQRILKCAQSPWPVLILGESGVGKEHVAHLIHEGAQDERRQGPFIPVNCAQYAGNIALANSDLFGHVKGAFTGADRDRKGKFVEAHTGTIFLDELGELPLEVQAKLLRVLEDGLVTPEGGDAATDAVDVRVVAATNSNLPAMIQAGSFREDLYHRLSTLCIEVPPLRERMEDLEVIVEQQQEILAGQGHTLQLSKTDWNTLKTFDWPGNVRQLIKLLQRKVVFEESIATLMTEEGLDSGQNAPTGDAHFPNNIKQCPTMDELKTAYAIHVWQLSDKNVAAAARTLDVQTNTLRYNYLKEVLDGK